MFTYPFIGPWKEHTQREHTQHRSRKTTVERQSSLSRSDRYRTPNKFHSNYQWGISNGIESTGHENKNLFFFFLKSNCIKKKYLEKSHNLSDEKVNLFIFQKQKHSIVNTLAFYNLCIKLGLNLLLIESSMTAKNETCWYLSKS